jgi:hypothetical protein
MFDPHSNAGLAGSTNSFVTAYGRLLDSIEQALSVAGVETELAIAQEEYAAVISDVTSMSGVQQRLDEASRRVSDVVARATEISSAHATLAEATRLYLQEIGHALPTLYATTPDLEALAAIASGMTTLAWLHGLRNGGGLDGVGSNGFFGSPSPGAWPAGNGDTTGTATPTTVWPVHDASRAGDGYGSISSAPSSPGDNDIVWQEFSVAEDGQITQRSVPASSYADGPAHGPPGRDAEPGDATSPFVPRRDAPSGHRAGGDPVEQVERALSTYQQQLRELGWAGPLERDPSANAVGQGSLDSSTAELTGAYLRLAQGVGTLPELYASYARYVATSIQLVERQLALTRSYEQLISAALAGRRPGDVRRTADHQYHSFLSSVREAWTRVDPTTLSPEQLAAMASSMALAADIHRAAT